MRCDYCEEPIQLSIGTLSCEGCGCQVHDYCERDAGWVRDPEGIPLCPACIGSIGGANGGPDAPYRPALEGESCGAADCQGAPDDDDDEPDAYEVWNATGSFPK